MGRGMPAAKRAVATMLAAASLCAAAVAPVAAQQNGSDGEQASVRVSRLSGPDRYATALEIAEEIAAAQGGHLDRVVIVSADSWADAVSAAPLTVLRQDERTAPVLLSHPERGPSADAWELIEATGVEHASIVSTAGAVPPSVHAGLRARRVGVQRIDGATAAAASAAVADAVTAALDGPLNSLAGDRGLGTVFVASADRFADGLAAAPLAGARRGAFPLLLTPGAALDVAVAAWLSEHSPGRAVILGGTAAVSAHVEAQIEAAGVTEVERIAGADRHRTAALAAAWAAETYRDGCYGGLEIGLARSDVPYDSLTAGPLLALHCAPLLLTEPGRIPPATCAALHTARHRLHSTEILTVHVFGGDSAVSNTALTAYRNGTCRWPGDSRWDRQAVGIDTWDRDAVLAAYVAEFDRPLPDRGFTGDVANCVAGTTSQEFRNSVIQRVNWYRRMAGAHPVTESLDLSRTAQHAALMMAAQGELSHSPGSDWKCYSQTGAHGASSNLSLGRMGTHAIDGYVQDSGSNNLEVGHRGWILFPQQMAMGTGDVPMGWGYNALYVLGPRAPTREVRAHRGFVAWPPPGYVPYTKVWGRWSFGLKADFSDATVEMADESGPVDLEVISRNRGFGDPAIVWAVEGDTDSDRHAQPADGERCYSVTISGAMVDSVLQDPYAYMTCVIDPDTVTP